MWLRKHKDRGALTGTVNMLESIELQTSDGPVVITLVEYRRGERGGKDRAALRVEAPKTVRIAFPKNAGLSLYRTDAK